MTHVIDLSPGIDAVIAGFSKPTRRRLRRAEELGMRVEEAPSALEAIYDLYLEQARGWRTHRPYPISFLQTLLDHPSRLARLFVVRIDDQPLSGLLVLTGGGETFSWWSGTAPESRRTHAHRYLLMQILVAEEKAGRKRFNIGSSGGMERVEDFKESIGAVARRVWVYQVKPRRVDPLTRLYDFLRRTRRRV
jgi:hypothetical protein